MLKTNENTASATETAEDIAHDSPASKAPAPKHSTSACETPDHKTAHEPQRGRFSKARAVAFACVIALTAVGLAFGTGSGIIPCSFGIDAVAALCPLGALETMVGLKGVMLHPLVLLAATALIVVAVGKAFCAWACPVPWLQKILPGKKGAHCKGRSAASDHAIEAPGVNPPPAAVPSIDEQSQAAPHACTNHCSSCSLERVGGERDGFRLDTRHATLLGALGATAVFGFPVFCLVCPIGLTFATFIGVWHLLQFNQTSWGLIVFPLVLIAELIILRRWCAKICPLGALMSLLANANRTFKPRVDESACLRSQGIDCRTCVTVCPEHVDPHSERIPECSKCGACIDHCPANAIRIKPLPKKKALR